MSRKITEMPEERVKARFGAFWTGPDASRPAPIASFGRIPAFLPLTLGAPGDTFAFEWGFPAPRNVPAWGRPHVSTDGGTASTWTIEGGLHMAAKKKDILVVGSKVKGFLKSKGMKTAGDTLEAVSDKVYCILDKAAERTKANKRATVRPCDL